MFLFPDISKLKGVSLTFGKLIVLAIIVALFYFLFSEINNYFVHILTKSDKSIQNDIKKEFTDNLDFVYSVSRVIDGDTLEIKRIDNERVLGGEYYMKVRLIGIDSPESVDTSKPIECFGLESSKYLKDISLGKVAAIEIDNTQGLYDKYGRILAYVFIKDNGIKYNNIIMLNEYMLKEGYAYEYNYNYPYKYINNFKTIQNISKNNFLGLWSQNTCDGLRSPVATHKEDKSLFKQIIYLLYNFQNL